MIAIRLVDNTKIIANEFDFFDDVIRVARYKTISGRGEDRKVKYFDDPVKVSRDAVLTYMIYHKGGATPMEVDEIGFRDNNNPDGAA